MNSSIYQNLSRHVTVISLGGKEDDWMRYQLSRGVGVQSLCDQFNTYADKLFQLLELVPDKDRRDELYEELDDTISCFMSKEDNKSAVRSILLDYVTDKDELQKMLDRL